MTGSPLFVLNSDFLLYLSLKLKSLSLSGLSSTSDMPLLIDGKCYSGSL